MPEMMYNDLVSGLLSVFADQAVRIILYGSTARGTNGPESDIDIALILSDKMTESQEDMLSEFIVDMDLKYDKVFSIIDIEDATYNKWLHVNPFYMNVEKEGIVLWKAA